MNDNDDTIAVIQLARNNYSYRMKIWFHSGTSIDGDLISILIFLFRLVYRSWFQVKYKMKPFVHEDGDTIADVHEKDNNTTAISFDVSQQR